MAGSIHWEKRSTRIREDNLSTPARSHPLSINSVTRRLYKSMGSIRNRIRQTRAVNVDWRNVGLCGVGTYIAGLALPFPTNLPLILLALAGLGIAVLSPTGNSLGPKPALGLPVLILLTVMGLATLMSVDPARSLRLSTPLMPGVLLFLVIGSSLSDLNSLRRLYLVFSLAAAGIAAMVLRVAITSDSPVPTVWMEEVGGTILVVPNDLTLLSLIAPLSFVVLYARPRSAAGILAGVSLMASVVAISVVQSRTAALALMASLTCTAALVQPRLAAPWTAAALSLALLVDAFLGFPLIGKFSNVLDTRLAVWWVAWSAFLDAPVLGQGPHTFALFYQPYLEQLPMVWLPVDPRNMPWAHNLYLEMLCEYGVLGLLALAWLFRRAIVHAGRLCKITSGETRLLVIGVLGGMAGFLISSLTELTFLRLWVVVLMFSFLGIIVFLARIVEQTEVTSSEYN